MVVLPAPFGPIRPTNPPFSTVKDTLLTAFRPPKFLQRLSTFSTDAMSPLLDLWCPQERPLHSSKEPLRSQQHRDDQEQGIDHKAEIQNLRREYHSQPFQQEGPSEGRHDGSAHAPEAT